MTNRELLELAAKAARIIRPDEFLAEESSPFYEGEKDPLEGWDPLNNDGDAFRLMTNLRIRLMYPDFNACGDSVLGTSPEVGGFVAEEPLTPDGYRLAVVRVAAEIGKSLT